MDRTIKIFGEIGERVTAQNVIDQIDLADPSDRLILDIHSPGGSYLDAIAIYERLKNFAGEVVTRVNGLAASAASIIFMAGKRREMSDKSWLMIHNPNLSCGGDAAEHRKAADQLEVFQNQLAGIYAEVIKKPIGEILDLMKKETWLSANDAISDNYATAKVAGLVPLAISKDWISRFNLKITNMTPEELAAKIAELEAKIALLEAKCGEQAGMIEDKCAEEVKASLKIENLVKLAGETQAKLDAKEIEVATFKAKLEIANDNISLMEKARGLAPAAEVPVIENKIDIKNITREQWENMNPADRFALGQKGNFAIIN